MTRFRRFFSMMLALVLIVGVLPLGGGAATAGFFNFQKRYTYGADTFWDVRTTDWYYENVKSVYESGLMQGKGAGKFDTESGVTLAETITIAARIHSIYHTGKDTFLVSTPWYQTYVNYCREYGILNDTYPDYNAKATRGQFASILVNALPSEALREFNTVDDNAIPDVTMSHAHADAIYRFYRCGIMVGNDSAGTFHPESEIRRCEVAAIAARMVDIGLRKSVTLEKTDHVSSGDNLTDGIIDLGDIVSMETAGTIEVVYHGDGSIAAIDGRFTNEKVKTEADAAKVLNAASSLFSSGFRAEEEEITVQRYGQGASAESFFRYNESINGVPVIGSEIIVSADHAGNVTGLHSTYNGRLDGMLVQANITADAAETTALNALLGRTDIAAFITQVATYASSGAEAVKTSYLAELQVESELSIYAADRMAEPQLVYEVTVGTYQSRELSAGDGVNQLAAAAGVTPPGVNSVYYIHANGESCGLLYRVIDMSSMWQASTVQGVDDLNRTRTIGVQTENGVFRLEDTARGITTYYTDKIDLFLWSVYSTPGTAAESSTMLTGTVPLEKKAVSAHANMTDVYDYYLNTLGRRSFDGDGAPIQVSINYGNAYDNAYWTASEQQFVFGSGGNYEAAKDVVGHEFTHGVISYVVGSGYDTGLTYRGETGAMNEAYADILGSFAEGKTDDGFWTLGEDMGSAMRSMSDPSLHGQPEHYSALTDAAWQASLNNYTNRDNEGVHVFSGIYAKAVHLMMTDSRTAGVTRDVWANIFYRSLFRLPSDAVFMDGRAAVIASAKAMGFNHEQQEAIKDAFDAVGISEPETVRIVLTWGAQPADLDSHLVGPGVNGGRFHIYYRARSYYNDGTYYSTTDLYAADLDYDDVTSYGPEVTTIHTLTDGEYYFYVHDYTHRGSPSSTSMSNSGAVVKVYWGTDDAPKATYTVTPSTAGIYWNVFKLTVSGSAVQGIEQINTYGGSASYR